MSVSHIISSTEPRKNIYADTLTATTFNVTTVTVTTLDVTGNALIEGKAEVKGDTKLDGNLQVVGNVTLPTTGGTASNLNFYEEYSFAPNFSGLWAAPKVCNVLVRRIGKICTVSFDGTIDVQVGGAITSTSSINMPARFIPAISGNSVYMRFSVPTFNNGVIVEGYASIKSDGTIEIIANDPVTPGDQSGWENISVTYPIT